MTLKPVGNRVVVSTTVTNQTESGLLLPDTTKKWEGEVTAIGDDCHCVNIGDTIVFRGTAQASRVEDGIIYGIVDADDILAVVCR
jgi:co-chaperonin GroES (HSP10)